MIDHVLVMNLKRREDKFFYLLGVLEANHFPVTGPNAPWGDTIIRFLSHDGEAYPDVDAIHRAAIEDGFAYFDSFRVGKRSHAAWWWTWVDALRTIVKMRDKIVLLLIDDFIPNMNWMRLRLLVEECVRIKEHGDFRGLQLQSNIGPLTRYKIEPFTYILQKGFVGNDNALVLNAAGAELLLEHYAEPPHVFPDAKLGLFAKRGINDEKYFKGFWHVIDSAFRPSSYSWGSDLA